LCPHAQAAPRLLTAFQFGSLLDSPASVWSMEEDRGEVKILSPSRMYMDSSRSSIEHDNHGGDHDRMRSYIRPVGGASRTPGHHGHPRTKGQSLNRGLEGPTLLSAWLRAGPTVTP